MSTESVEPSPGAKPFLEWKIGDETPDGDKIARLYGASAEYAVYLTKGRRVAVATDDETEQRWKQCAPEVLKYKMLAAQLKAKPDTVGNDFVLSVARCASGDVDGARDVLTGAIEALTGRLQMEGRLGYLLTCMIFAAAVGLVAFLLAMWQPIRGELLAMAYVAACGALGGLLSAALSLNRLELDPSSGSRISMVSAFSRIFVAVVAAWFVYFLIRANIVLGLLAQTRSLYAVYAVCVVAGFSERFVPNIMSRIKAEETGTTPDA